VSGPRWRKPDKSVDGQLARYRRQFSRQGWRIDLYSDRISASAIPIAYHMGFDSIQVLGFDLDCQIAPGAAAEAHCVGRAGVPRPVRMVLASLR
jgi:hypothetical protein